MKPPVLKTYFFILLGFFWGASEFSASTCLAAGPRTVRVAVLRGRTEITLSVAGSFEMADVMTGQVVHKGRNLGVVRVESAPDGLKVGAEIFSTDALLVTARSKAGIVVNKRPYRGTVILRKDKDATLLVVNVVDLESYVKGVLYHEISNKWPMDAIKAQAVATRTYAVYQQDVMKSQPYDMTADTSSQVYGGYASEKSKTNRAVNFTTGEVLFYQGKIFPAYFHAVCGGGTENARELWLNDIEPLGGGRPCTYCATSPHFFWKTEMTLDDIQKKLDSGYALTGALAQMAVKEFTTTRRVKTLELSDDKGATQVVAAKDLRRILDPNVLRSTRFSVVVKEGRAFFEGTGWGHGVGLCQWGAKGMAVEGLSYVDILKFYYPGAKVVRLT